MNERIRELLKQAGWGQGKTYDDCMRCSPFDPEKFAELIVAECLAQVARVDDMLEDEPAQHAAVAWVASSIADHFGVAKPQSDWDQEAAAFIAAEDKKVASRYGYVPKLHPSEWKD
jgi:hypothetical protein